MSKKDKDAWKLEAVAKKIIEKIEAGEIDPWKKPFGFGSDRARNLKSKRPYSGVNCYLSMIGKWFVTMHEAAELHINFSHFQEVERKTRSGKPYKKQVPIDKDGQEMKPCKGLVAHSAYFRKNCYWLDGKNIEWKEILNLMTEHGVDNVIELKKALENNGKKLSSRKKENIYNIFNVDDLPKDGKYERLFPADNKEETNPISECLAVLRNMPDKPIITHRITSKGKDCAYYPSEDRVNIPYARDFDSIESYHSTLFHELVHSTGHECRLNRHDEEQVIAAFGSKDYSKEELVAEFGASMLCAHTGIAKVTLSNSTNYIASWLRVLKNDLSLLPKAIDLASRSVEYIAGIDSYKKIEDKQEKPIESQPESEVEETIIEAVESSSDIYTPILDLKDMKKYCVMLNKIVPKKTDLPCFKCILVEGKGNTLSFTGTDLEQRLTLKTVFSDNVGNFKYLIEFRKFREIVNSSVHKTFSFGTDKVKGSYHAEASNESLEDYLKAV